VATDRVAAVEASDRNKVLRVEINGTPRDLAVVDVAISNELWIGSRALWRADTLTQIFVTFAEADAIGLSSIAGLLHPVSRRAPHGLRVDLAPLAVATTNVAAPIAPGRVVRVGIGGVHEMAVGEPVTVESPNGVIALDGEREIEFSPADRVTIRLENDGPWTIEIDRVMAQAAREGLLTECRLPCGLTHSTE